MSNRAVLYDSHRYSRLNVGFCPIATETPIPIVLQPSLNRISTAVWYTSLTLILLGRYFWGYLLTGLRIPRFSDWLYTFI